MVGIYLGRVTMVESRLWVAFFSHFDLSQKNDKFAVFFVRYVMQIPNFKTFLSQNRTHPFIDKTKTLSILFMFYWS